jgi:tRNA 2-thiocytidine biosynthesis protein TtcA
MAKKVAKTIKKYRMISEGDRVLVGVSGGKDSLTLLHLLHERHAIFPNDYELLAVHVASTLPCEGAADPSRIERHFKDTGCAYRIIHNTVPPDNRGRGGAYWCSRNRRRALFDAADQLGYNRIALGHHRNDVVETVMLNMFYHGELSSMLPRQDLFEGKMSIIRPLYLIPEADTARFCRTRGLEPISCSCASGETRREMFKRLVGEIEKQHPRGMINAVRALENVNLDYLPAGLDKDDDVNV